MSQKVRWGVLGVAAIAVKKVIPAMQQGDWCEVVAIASRDRQKAERAAKQLGIGKPYGSYEELLADPAVEAIYNPLPNHLHVPWSIRAAEAGKHVLCEKPIGLSVSEARQLLDVRDRTGVRSVRLSWSGRTRSGCEPANWRRKAESAKCAPHPASSATSIQDPGNIRNVLEYGGGGLMDIGCYPIQTCRFIFGQEPRRVAGLVERDPEMKTDRLASVILDFPSAQAIFTCSTQLVPYQRMQFYGTRGRIEVEIPFNAPPNRPCRILVDDGSDLFGTGISSEEFQVCDQYTLQGDQFSRAIHEGGEVPTPLEDSIRNMAVIEAIFRSAESGRWETPTV